jgi:hypothetical protein
MSQLLASNLSNKPTSTLIQNKTLFCPSCGNACLPEEFSICAECDFIFCGNPANHCESRCACSEFREAV